MTDKEIRARRIQWFREARFGMFIHWGLYAIPARGEWVRSRERMSNEDYQPYFEEFDPTRFDPKGWARAAREAGMKYAVLTAKHHDGFCLFDSALTDYKVTNTPFGRDVVREFLDAFRAEGLRVGLYYSLLDWHHPDYPHYGDLHHPMRDNEAFKGVEHHFENYVAYLHGQVRELCSNYGKLDILWFDFSYGEMAGEKWEGTRLVEMVRSLQPDVLIDSRLEGSGDTQGSLMTAHPKITGGDFACPEQMIPPYGVVNEVGEPVPWEACVTMNNNWGYAAADTLFKPASMLIGKLVECVAKGGNFLLNVGPDARGCIPEASLAILSEIGRWMQRNSESIYGAGMAGLPKPNWGWYTKKGDCLYAHVLTQNIGPYEVPGVKGWRALRLLRDGSAITELDAFNVHSFPELKFFNFGGFGAETAPLPDPIDTVVKIIAPEVE